VDELIDTLKLSFLVNNFDVVAQRFSEHLHLTLVSLLIALIIALPIGVFITRYKRLEGLVMGLLGVLYTVPSLALLVLLIPFVGLGTNNATIVLVTYAQVILVRNIVVGLNGVDPGVIEAARGMGMSAWQRLIRVELPLALPVILAGVRIATVTLIGIGVVAALINAGGLGRLLFEGISRNSETRIVAGAIGAAALAGVANGLLRLLERRTTRALYGEEA
jgi:osmoprotectant transport system permease protein